MILLLEVVSWFVSLTWMTHGSFLWWHWVDELGDSKHTWINHTQDWQVKMLVVHYQLLCIPITSWMMRMLPGHRVTGFFLSTSSVFAARREEQEDVVQQRLHEANYKETSVTFDSCFVFWWKKPFTVLQLLVLHPKKMSVNEWVLTWLLAIAPQVGLTPKKSWVVQVFLRTACKKCSVVFGSLSPEEHSHPYPKRW